MPHHLNSLHFDITENSYTAGQELSVMRKQPIISFCGTYWVLHVCEQDKHSCPFPSFPTSLR